MKGCKVMGDFVPKCSQKHGKGREPKDFTFQAFVKMANSLARYDDQEHQNQNFTASIMVVSIIL